jgi:putative nucleotidyltransferase with HDIG domain
MGKISIEWAKDLLERLVREDKRLVPESFIPHSMGVSNIAYHIGRLLLQNGYKVDVDLARVGGLLHDCGKRVVTTDEMKKDPELLFDNVYGYNYLKENGYPEVADVILPNFTNKELYILKPELFPPDIKPEQLEPKNHEQKLVVYGDTHTDSYGNRVSFNWRLDEIKNNYKFNSLLMESLNIGGEIRLRDLNYEINKKVIS